MTTDDLIGRRRCRRTRTAHRVAIAAVALLGTVGCSDDGGLKDETSPVITAGEPATDVEAALVAGVLELDDGCLFVRSDEPDQLFALVWPFGTTLDRNEVRVSGQRLRIGHRFTAGGGYHSIEDLDPFNVDQEALDRLRTCVDRTNGEVAVIQTGPTEHRGLRG